MKKTKFLPALLLAGLLASCSAGISDKEPTFKAEGSKVEYSAFQEKLEAAYEASEIYKEDANLADRVLELRSVEKNESSVTRKEKEISKSTQTELSKTNYEFDFDASVAKAATVREASSSGKATNGSSSSKTQYNPTYYFQKGTVEDKTYLLNVSEKEKTYATMFDIEGIEKYLNSFAKNQIENFVSSYFLSKLPYETPDDKWSFYVTGEDKVFTFEHNVEETTDNDDYTEVRKETLKAQVDITDGAQTIAFETVSERTTTYKKEMYSFAKDDVFKQVSTEYFEGKTTSKGVDLKALDIAEYTRVGSIY